MTARYKTRARTCNFILIAFALLFIIALQLIFGRREPKVVEQPTPTPTATRYADRRELAFLPTNTPFLEFQELPTFTVTPTITPTPTLTPTGTITPTPTSTAVPTYAAKVKTELVNVRSGPGIEYAILASLPQNEDVTVIGRTDLGNWLTVRLEEGEPGWILTELLTTTVDMPNLVVNTPPPVPTATPPPDGVTVVENINMRSGPGINYDVVTFVALGIPLDILGRDTTGEWLAVRTPEGEEGWIYSILIQLNIDNATLTVIPAPPTPTPLPATPTPQPIALAAAAQGAARIPRVVLANYFTWYDSASWDGCNISAGDRPLQLYHSDDPEAIARHVRTAIDAGVDGFTLQWASPGDRTDQNFATLLNKSQGTDFQSTVVFLRHIWPGATQGNTISAIRHLQDQYGSHPNFLKINGRPVIFFTDVPRIPRAAGQNAKQAWASVRAQVDPGKNFWWIAEGLDSSYLSVFDGLWVYKVSHAAYPNDYTKASSWANRVRSWEQRTGEPKLWVGTLMPGWDDRRAGCRPDIRVPSQPFVRDREGGNFYRATYNAAVKSNPDVLWIHSFNEWVEGSYIEPSQYYGNTYLNLTREFSSQFTGG